MSRKIIRVIVDFPEDMYKELFSFCEENNINKADYIRQALRVLNMLQEAQQAGKEIKIDDSDLELAIHGKIID